MIGSLDMAQLQIVLRVARRIILPIIEFRKKERKVFYDTILEMNSLLEIW